MPAAAKSGSRARQPAASTPDEPVRGVTGRAPAALTMSDVPREETRRSDGMAALAQTRSFGPAIRTPYNSHSPSMIFPVSPSPTCRFGKKQSGTDFGKAGAPEDGCRSLPGNVPLYVPNWEGRISKCRPIEAYRGICLAACMTRMALALLMPLAGCSPQPSSGCPPIEKLIHQDAAADARAALARGDRRLLMLNGPFGAIGPPGVESPNLRFDQVRIMEGTSKNPTEACDRLRSSAEAYATKYNQAIVGKTGR
jgi:hypothetical protein